MHIRKRYMHFLDKGRPKGLLGKGYWVMEQWHGYSAWSYRGG